MKVVAAVLICVHECLDKDMFLQCQGKHEKHKCINKENTRIGLCISVMLYYRTKLEFVGQICEI